MTIASLTEELGLKQSWEAPHKELPVEHLECVQPASASLAASIRDGTITAEQIDSFLRQSLEFLPESNKRDIHEFLVYTKATLLSGKGREPRLMTLPGRR